MQFSNEIIAWYSLNKRDLPWRNSKNPYKIWLSEIILQQTQVKQGLPYYLKFIKEFPSVKSLALATEEAVLKLWQGLGYYSRARNLHETARYVHFKLAGKFPDNFGDLLVLKGVGEYTAAAIASIAFNEPVAVVDGNVFRVLSRIFGIETPINSGKGKKEFFDLSMQLIDKKIPNDYNQAVMEFGSLHCTPVSPKCENCIFRTMCVAYGSNRISDFPVKIGKAKIRHRYFDYFHILSGDYTYIYKRTKKDIWKNLYEFPLTESEEESNMPSFDPIISGSDTTFELKKTVKHILSHQVINAKFWRVQNLNKGATAFMDKNFIKINQSALQDYPVSRLTEKYLESNLGTVKK